MEAVTGQSGVGPAIPRCRHGVRPSFRRPRKRAKGWIKCSAAVSNRRRSRVDHRTGPPGNGARAALSQAWATGAAIATASIGNASLKGRQTVLNAAIPARLAVIRCHSGICGREPSRLGAGWYKDWNGAAPQTPWYTRGRRQPSACVSPSP